ncbi:aspartate/glutamate racemase family protein [Nocardiopsis sp. RSe5-2]|uniref:Aspartate/glutamate racemase family protein n=1 Tax=Nocardiopsis endophytica TaxID=3018445 RepID=A0ABT4UCE8_9ACTN|nr:aspartate/glutamate racemase family protein [Nocardiopsis endophytica]MDA2814605.1 aspartate/glutamate racemase family protein [Nocardiopsis endophytica]
MLSTAAALRAARPDADLVLSMDPDHMPWGPRSHDDVVARVITGAEAAAAAPGGAPDAVVVPCNTASVHGLVALRSRFEPRIPVIGTVPPIKPAAQNGGPIAVWATVATTASRYQGDLIERYAPGGQATPVACVGLAEAVESADPDRVAEAVAYAAERTPAGTRGVVLGCTHYDLVDAEITAALGGRPALFTAAQAVAAQTLRRIGAEPEPGAAPTGTLRVLASGRPSDLPKAALAYPAGQALAVGPVAE